MPIRHQIARFNATNTITILLDRYTGPNGRPLTLRQLAVTFAITIREIVDALSLPANHEFARALYVQLHDAGAADELFGTEDVPPLADVEDQLDVEAAREFVFEWIGQCYERGWTFDDLEVPPIELELPSSPELVALVVRMYGHGTRPDRIIQFMKITYPREEVGRLKELTRELRDATAAAEKRLEKYAATTIALDKIALACDLQRRHWWHESRNGRATEEEYREHAKPLNAAIAEARKLRERVTESVDPDPEELAVAASLLTYFDPDERQQLANFMLEFSEFPKLFEPSDVAEFIDAIEDAVEALTMSARCEEFTRDHLLPFFDLSAMSPGSEFEDQFRMLSNALVADCNENWRLPIVAMQEVIGKPKGRTTLETMTLFMKAERTARNIVVSALNPFFMKYTMAVLFRSSQGGNWKSHYSLGTFLLRQLAVNFTVVGTQGLELAHGRTGVFKRLMTDLETISRAKDGKKVAAAAKNLKDLRLGSSFTRGRVAIGLNFVGYSLAFMCACGSAPAIDAGPSAHLKFLASVGSGFTGMVQQYYRFGELRAFLCGSDADELTTMVRRFGAAANLLSALASAVSAVEKFKKAKVWPGYIDAAAALGSGLIGAAQLLEIVSWSRTAAIAGGVGYLIAGAAIAALIVYEALNDGAEPVVDGLEEFIADARAMKVYGSHLQEALARARPSMTVFRERAGEEQDDPYVGPPTVWNTHQLGFAVQEIVRLFDSSNVYVKTVLTGAEQEAQA